MNGVLFVAALVLVFLGVEGIARRLPPRHRAWPFWALGLLLGAVAFEASRFDHGRGDLLFSAAYVAAPLVAIFGAALWGARRFYGWPDLGPLPGRAAGVSALLMLGILVAVPVRERDVRETERRAQGIAERVAAWRDAHGGEWPAALDAAAPDRPRTALGAIAPPAFTYEVSGSRAVLRFPLSSERRRSLDLATGTWSTERAP